jgi:hypothetical protein
MLKVILSAIVSLGISTLAFADEPTAPAAPAGNEGGAPPADKKMDKKMDKKAKKKKGDKKDKPAN